MGFGSFENDSQRINALSYTFPLVFFLVAALVAFTSMVRIIEDDRAAAAAMVSLGYNTGAIMRKYLIYALAVAVPGTVLGIAAGHRLLPVIVFNFGYRLLYLLPPIQARLYAGLCAQALLICVASVVLPAFFVSLSLYKQAPAQLTRPKAPQGGKRVFLENLKTLWHSLSFSAKVTARNILRYKKRFAMTVAGIVGCTAIILTGFGLRDSIKSITAHQFGDIYHFSLRVTIANEAKGSQRSALDRFLTAEKEIEAWQYQRRESIEVSFRQTGEAQETTLVIPQDPENLDQFIHLATPGSGKTVSLTDRGAVITEKLASLLGVRAGDSITLEDEDDNVYQVDVEAITENYVEHFLYMTPAQYSYVFDQKLNYNTLLCRTPDLSQSRQDELGLAILELGGVSALAYNSRVQDFYQDMISSLNVVVLVLILSGALLSFVVLFCLTGINIDERKRELATLRVLGFYEEEAAAYIFRENIVNTVIGVILGLGAGVLLHQYIIRTAEIDLVMFGKAIAWPSYVFAAVLTFLFTLFVNQVMTRDICNIDMVESLKSAE
jgi:putative ABC transport system permease protein